MSKTVDIATWAVMSLQLAQEQARVRGLEDIYSEIWNNAAKTGSHDRPNTQSQLDAENELIPQK